MLPHPTKTILPANPLSCVMSSKRLASAADARDGRHPGGQHFINHYAKIRNLPAC
jgi:hypothetical protein